MRKKKIFPLFALCLVVLQSIVSLFSFSGTASALTQDEMIEQVRKYSYYSAFHACIVGDHLSNYYKLHGNGTASSNLADGAWLTIGYAVDSDGDNNDGGVECKNAAQFVMTELGFSEDELLLGLGYEQGKILDDDEMVWEKGCAKRDQNNNCTESLDNATIAAKFKALVEKKGGIPTEEPSFALYYMAFFAYTKGCGASEVNDAKYANEATNKANGYAYITKIKDESGATESVIYHMTASTNDAVHAFPRPNDTNENDGKQKCGDLLVNLNGVAVDNVTNLLKAEYKKNQEAKIKDAVSKAIQAHCRTLYPQTGDPVARLRYESCVSTTYAAYEACWTQVKLEGSGGYRDRTAKEKRQCLQSKGAEGDETALDALVASIDKAIAGILSETPGEFDNSTGGGSGSTEAECTGGALGWILCPLIDVFTDVINMTADFLNNMLVIRPIGSNDELRGAWGTFVGIANLLLVIGFLVVIFSQATSIGLSAYGIKKMLPRIIAAAILINLSYFICTIALDIINIVGGSVGGIIQGFIPDSTSLSNAKTLNRSDSWASWIGLSVAGAVAGAIATAVGAIAFIIPLLLSVAFAAVAIFLIVALRQVVVILLIIIAPLAFAAMILPNTEPLFTKWRKLFTNMLIMYPVVMFILYGSQLVGALVLTSKSTTSSDTNGWIFDIVSTIIMTVGPFAMLYMYLKNSNKLMGMAAGGVGKLGAWGQKKAQGFAKNKYDRSTFGVGRATQRAFKDEAAKERAFGRMKDKTVRGRIGMMGVRGTARDRMNAYAEAQGDKLYKSDVDNEQVRLGKNIENNATASVEAFKKKVATGSMTKAQANAHVNHLLGMKGGKTSLRRLFEDQSFMQGLEKAGGTDGMVLGAMNGDKFMAAQPDLANALNYHREQFTKDARDGKANEYLGANYASGVKTSSGKYVIDKEYKNAAGNVINKGQGAFQDWGWYAQRPGMLHAMSHDHTGHVYDKVSFNVATATQKDPAFSNADPGIQDMINAIVAAGPPPSGSTATNNLGTFTPGAAGNPSWLNWS